ncbi:MAG: ABC transporter ATP-binding protein [Acidobacteriota bacterium]
MAETLKPLVQVENLCKVYQRNGHPVSVLEGTNLEIPEGEFLALMGPSGSGKTTLLNLIAGIDRPTSGRIVVNGWELGGMGEGALTRWRSTHIGFVFQLYNLIPVLTAYENVEMPLLLTRLRRRKRRDHVMTALRVVGLEDRARHTPRQLSGGQEQRVAIARAIVADPVLLVADEPTGDLDARSADEILDLMARLNQEFHKTILLVTHDLRAARRAKHCKYLEKGVLSDHSAWEEDAAAGAEKQS